LEEGPRAEFIEGLVKDQQNTVVRTTHSERRLEKQQGEGKESHGLFPFGPGLDPDHLGATYLKDEVLFVRLTLAAEGELSPGSHFELSILIHVFDAHGLQAK